LPAACCWASIRERRDFDGVRFCTSSGG
jgi:hypothetical protein